MTAISQRPATGLPSSHATTTGASLAVHDVFKIYKENEVQTVALRGASLRVEPGEFVAVVGRSGSGKSTLFSLLAGLAEPSAGRIEIDGRDLGALGEPGRARLRRERIGVTFQSGNLLPYLSALENVALPLEFAGHPRPRERAAELLTDLGLAGRQGSKPAQLSGGEQARVALAMALANRPGLLLADEPTGELDTHTAAEIVALIEGLNRDKGLTVLLVTHNPELAARAGRRVRITDGVLSEEGDA